MARSKLLTRRTDGEPPVRDDGSLAIVELRKRATVDGQDHYGQPVIVARWNVKMQTTGGARWVEYLHRYRVKENRPQQQHPRPA